MTRSNTTSTAPFTQSGVASSSSSVYFSLVTIELTSIAIKYHDTDPFKERHASLLTFIIATFCHAIALPTKTTWLGARLFHVSGVTACVALLWVLVTELFWCILVIVIMLLVMASIIYHKCICDLLFVCLEWIVVLETNSTRDPEDLDTTNAMPDLEAQEGNTFHSLLCCCYTHGRFLLQHFDPTYSLFLAGTRV